MPPPKQVGRSYPTGFTVVVTKSTVPVGTGDEIEAILRRVRPDGDFAVVSNPEFLREGSAIEDFLFKCPDRVVVGTEDMRAQGLMWRLPPALPQRDADPLHLAPHVGTDEVRRQRLPRDEDHFHQPDGRSLRSAGRRRAAGRARHRPRQAHRAEIPPCRPRLWRLVLSDNVVRTARDAGSPVSLIEATVASTMAASWRW
ncbi:MAG: hypothetical protein QM764_24595 [Chitinophagaceae bacterium]